MKCCCRGCTDRRVPQPRNPHLDVSRAHLPKSQALRPGSGGRPGFSSRPGSDCIANKHLRLRSSSAGAVTPNPQGPTS